VQVEISNTKQKLDSVPYLTRKNLELFLGNNRRTVDDRIKSLIKSNVIFKLKNGLYVSTNYLKQEPDRQKYLEYLSNALYQPSYISLEYALSLYGLIPESVYSITSVSPNKTKKFDNSLGVFSYRKIKNELFFGFRDIPYKTGSISFATKAKCLFDFLLLKKGLTGLNLEQYLKYDSRINWGVLKIKDKQEFREYVKKSNSLKMKRLQKKLITFKLI